MMTSHRILTCIACTLKGLAVGVGFGAIGAVKGATFAKVRFTTLQCC